MPPTKPLLIKRFASPSTWATWLEKYQARQRRLEQFVRMLEPGATVHAR